MSAYAYVFSALVLSVAVGPDLAHAEPRSKPQSHAQIPAVVARPVPENKPATAKRALLADVRLSDIGFLSGFRFANLGGRREVFLPLPQASEIAPSELVLVLDDMSAHEARRSLEVLVNDRSALAIMLDGRSTGRTVRVPLAGTSAKEGFLKLTFIYSGAATPDRCVDVRYVGDSLVIRPESAIEVDLGAGNVLDVATTAALMPRQVSLVLPGRRLTSADIVTALTVARSLLASGRRISWHSGYESLPDAAALPDATRWSRGIVVIGSLADLNARLDAPVVTLAAAGPNHGTLAAVRIRGVPALLVADDAAARAGRLLASDWLGATRGVTTASAGDTTPPRLPLDRVTFDQLGVAPAQAEVFGRADLTAAIDAKRLPAGTRPARLLLQMMVAPDPAGEKAVVSAYVNESLLGSAVAASGEPTLLDLALPDGLVGTSANVRAVVQRRSAQGDCRFEPQGYPAQILGASAVVLTPAAARATDFTDLATRWSSGVEILLPASAAERPNGRLALLAGILNALTPDAAPLSVRFFETDKVVTPTTPFLLLGDAPPVGATPRVRFDRGRVAVADRSGRTLLDLAGFAGGVVAQVVNAGEQPGLWVRPLSAAAPLPAPRDLKLDRGDVAFVDRSGVALAMSTERDTLVRISYPDQVSWLSIADRFRPWLIGSAWLFATVVLLFGLQRIFRRRPNETAE